MLARCAHCRQDFETDRFGVQTCPHCGWEILLPDPESPATPGSTGSPDAPGGPPHEPPAAEPSAAPGAPPSPSSPPSPPWQPGAWPAPAGWPPPPGAAPPPEYGESAPFAQRKRLGFFEGFSQTWRLVAFEPAAFFRRVRTSESGSALLFGVLAFSLGAWVSLLLGWVAGRAGTTAMLRVLERFPMRNVDPDAVAGIVERAAFGGALGQAVLTPLFGVVSIYLVAAIAHVLLLAVRGAPRGFTTTLTTIAYAYGLFVLEALPMCGGVVAVFWFLVVAITGLAESQRCGGAKAGFAVLGPAVLACLCLCACGGWAVVASKLPGRIDFGRPGEGTGL